MAPAPSQLQHQQKSTVHGVRGVPTPLAPGRAAVAHKHEQERVIIRLQVTAEKVAPVKVRKVNAVTHRRVELHQQRKRHHPAEKESARRRTVECARVMKATRRITVNE